MGIGYGSDPFLDEREIYPEWFEADSADQCDDVPDNVNTGRIRDVCGDVSRKIAIPTFDGAVQIQKFAIPL